MKQTEQNNVRLIVKDEQDLYTPFNPEAEFSYSVQEYLRSKIGKIYRLDYSHGIILTVISQEPINEVKFRSAQANWISDEKALFRIKEKATCRLLITLLVTGSILLMLSMSLVKRIDVLQYSLLPIMASLALSKATGMLLIDIPISNAKKHLLNQMEKNSVIVFERENHFQEN